MAKHVLWSPSIHMTQQDVESLTSSLAQRYSEAAAAAAAAAPGPTAGAGCRLCLPTSTEARGGGGQATGLPSGTLLMHQLRRLNCSLSHPLSAETGLLDKVRTEKKIFKNLQKESKDMYLIPLL